MAPRGGRVLFKALLFTVLVPGTVTVVIPYLLISSLPDFRFGFLRFLGGVAVAIGVIILLRCTWDFAREGLGTPAPIDPPKVLVAKGLYRYVRNPMYIGVGVIVLGEAMLFESRRLLIYATIVALCFHSFVVFYEERALRKRFGEIYEQYRRTVPRWLPKWPGESRNR